MQTLSGMRILIVEDEFFIAKDIARYFVKLGATILGPAPNLEKAFQYAESADAAILDIDLQGVAVFPVADRLLERAVPFVFFSGCENKMVPSRLRHISNLAKPTSRHRILAALFPDATSQPAEVDPDDVVSLLPKLRLAARLLLSDERAADRLVERTLRDAIQTVGDRPDDWTVEDWLNGLLREAAKDAADLLH
jgi:CheY-like chemotaxis protein